VGAAEGGGACSAVLKAGCSVPVTRWESGDNKALRLGAIARDVQREAPSLWRSILEEAPPAPESERAGSVVVTAEPGAGAGGLLRAAYAGEPFTASRRCRPWPARCTGSSACPS
jgi:hypothetical protein